MCARFAQAGSSLLAGPFADLTELWAGGGRPVRYNIAPTQAVPIVRPRENGDGYRVDALRWGLVPGWAEDAEIGSQLVNARSETAAVKPAFRRAFQERRCVVPASGFFEWKTLAHGKEPHYVFRRDGVLMLMAGLWERWRAPQAERVLETFTILTCAPNAFMRELHERMPVVLEPEAACRWLAPDAGLPALHALLVPTGEGTLASYPVNRRVNDVRNDDPACLERVSAPGLFD